MPIQVPDPDAWYEVIHGIPRPNWTLFDDWITTEADAELFDEAWDTMVVNWLRRMAAALGPEYRIAQSDHALLLAPHTVSECKTMLTAIESAHSRVVRTLGELCAFHHGRVLVLRFSDADHYYRYITQDDGEQHDAPMSGGMCIPSGMPHVVCHSRSLEEFYPTVAHELAHFYTIHMESMPSWISEGIAMAMEGDSAHLPSSEDVEKHRAHWNTDTIQLFWSGESWQRAGEGFGLSYGLAAMLFSIIRTEVRPPPEAFRAFVRDASREDAGADAAERHLRVELSELVEEFLGPGDWSPRPW